MKRLRRAKECKCECGGYAKPDNKFIHGHNMRGIRKFGKDNCRWGTKHTEHTKSLISEARKGRRIKQSQKDAISKKMSGKNHPFYGKKRRVETRIKCSIANTGEKHWNWLGGKSNEGYCCEFWNREYRSHIKERDDYKCQNPLCWGTSNRMCIHHIDYDKKDCRPMNLILVCTSCNARANQNREFWQKHYEDIMVVNNDRCKSNIG